MSAPTGKRSGSGRPTRARGLMIQGTGSNVGKSSLVAGLARAYTRRGLRVLPFKPQNMSNNAAVTFDGGEIGRAQALQAFACRALPETDMNPVLLKPTAETGAQIILQGKIWRQMSARDYQHVKRDLLGPVMESYNRLAEKCDLILVEGAGAASEVNLRAHDIANMGFARAADLPVILAGDIDRGGVIANLVGTKIVMAPDDAAQICGFIVNKMRGDTSLFAAGMATISHHTGWDGLGIVPYFPDLRRLPAEDSLSLESISHRAGVADIIVLILPHIANFDDLDPLLDEPDLDIRLVRVDGSTQIAPHVPRSHLIILPGSKSVIQDLTTLKRAGWDEIIRRHVAAGGHVWGLCGGYQMLGRTICDPDHVESPVAEASGIGLLDVDTVIRREKSLIAVQGDILDGKGRKSGVFEGYEIHCGTTSPTGRHKKLIAAPASSASSAQTDDGRVFGTYVHGLFDTHVARQSLLARIGRAATQPDKSVVMDDILDRFADHLEAHLNLDDLLRRAR
ncbi:Cobyric acid synthase [Acetobacteraceae bacterium EV16G]|uniref:Cobyric acid synthase n=2 Tax=Sorlinia euscelidii TaxID=3081148 RepID=A0ABU7U0P1_9PROT